MIERPFLGAFLLVLAACAGAEASGVAAHAEARAPASASPTCGRGEGGSCTASPPSFAADVAPVLRARCLPCHAGDGIAAEDHDFSRLATLRDQRTAAAAQVAACAMPPAEGTPLSAHEATVLERWLACGAPDN